MKIFSKIQFLFVIMVVFFSCNPETDYPIEPYIEDPSFGLSEDGSSLFISFHFQDGDGDIGFHSVADTLDPYVGEYRNNVHIHVLDKDVDGGFSPMIVRQVVDSEEVIDTIVYDYRTTYLETESKNHSIKGRMQVEVNDFAALGLASKYGVVCFDIYLYDRALRRSNVVRTPELSLR